MIEYMRVLLVTISIGEKYIEEHDRLFRTSQENYAKKHGYEFKVIQDYLDPTYKEDKISMYFQKMLVCSQTWSMDYDYIVYIDSDIYININAPPIHSHCDFGDKIGVVDEMSQPSYDKRMYIHSCWGFPDQTVAEYYALSDFTLDIRTAFNSGVIVYQPKKHMEYMESFYHTYLPKSIGHPRYPIYEQTAFSYVLHTTDMAKEMTNKFNAVWNWTRSFGQVNDYTESLEDYFHSHYFVHMAGRTDYDKIPSLDEINIDTENGNV